MLWFDFNHDHFTRRIASDFCNLNHWRSVHLHWSWLSSLPRSPFVVIGVNLDEKVGGPYLFLSFTLPSILFRPPLPWSGVQGFYPRKIFWFSLCCRWVLEHFGATKGWLLIKGFVVRNFWKFVWWAYFLPISSLTSPLITSLLPSFVSVPLLQSYVILWKLQNSWRQYKEACINELNKPSCAWQLWNALPNDVELAQ